MNGKQWMATAFGVSMLISASGCATVMSGKHAEVSFYSNVPNADVVIRNKRGEQVAVTQTQSKVALKRNDRYIFPARYTATFMAPGYQPVDVPIRSKINPWILGNVVVGGIPGLAVDNVTGAAWTPKQSSYYQELSPAAGPQLGPVYSGTNPLAPMHAPPVLAGAEAAAAPIYTASATNYTAASVPIVAAPPTSPPAAGSPVPQVSPGLPW